jgi:ABC-type lipoprotein release transport system permease subunit
MGKLLAILVGVLLGVGLVAALVTLTAALLVFRVLFYTMMLRRDWVPPIYNVRSLLQRRVTTGVTVAGLALVAAVFAGVLMLSAGIDRTLAATGLSQNVKVIRKGSQTEQQSSIEPKLFNLLGAQAEVAKGADGRPQAGKELVVLIYALKAGATEETQGSNLSVRGVDQKIIELHPLPLVAGRMFTPGTSEIVLGERLVGRFQGAELGGTMTFARRDWKVVGIVDGGGSAFSSEVWTDVEQAMDAFGRRPAFSAITLRLDHPARLETLAARIDADPQLNTLEMKREDRYWADQSEQLSLFVKFLGMFVTVIFTFGAILGAMITMYAQVAARVRELGTLRALGFRRRSVFVSIVHESMLLGLIAGVIGLALASATTLISFGTVNWQTFSEVVFRFELTPTIVVATLLFSSLMGFAGGLLPAVRASRMPIVEATRG